MQAVQPKYEDIVHTAVKAAAAIGIPGAVSFGLDVTVMAGIWATMMLSIAERSGYPMDGERATKLMIGVAKGVAAYIGGSKLAISAMNLIPGAGTLAAMGVNSLLDATYTYKLGCTLSRSFESIHLNRDDSNIITLLVHDMLPNLDDLVGVAKALTSW